MQYISGTSISRIHVISFILFLAIISVAMTASDIPAANPSDKLAKIQDRIKSSQQEVEKAKKKENALISKIEDLDSGIHEKVKELKVYDKRITDTRSQIQNLTSEIDELSNDLDSKKEYLKALIQDIYKRQYKSNALILMSAQDYQDLITKSKYISLIAHYDSTLIDQYSTKLRKINSNKETLESLQGTLVSSKKAAQGSKEKLLMEKKKKDRLLTIVSAKRSLHEKKLKQLEESSQKLHSMIERIKAKQIPASILGEGFQSLKGRLPWPVNGEILAPFGEYTDPEFNTTAVRNGIEIGTESEAVPKTIAGGRVVYIGKIEGYGNMVLIDQGDGYHSLYANLSGISLKSGNIVAKGFDIGTVGTSGDFKVPALYFEIRYKGKPIDPAKWLAGKI